MKIWSNECVWRPINGPRWRKKMIKWMWCCYRIMSRQAVDLMPEMLHLMPMSSNALTVECDVRHAASGRETVRCTLTIVCWRGLAVAGYASKCDARWLHPMLMHQMHWRSCLWPELLHPMLRSSSALAILSVLLLAIELKGGQALNWWRRRGVGNEARNAAGEVVWCQTAAFDVDVIRCTLAVVSMSVRCCIRSHRDQMRGSWCPSCCIRSRWG